MINIEGLSGEEEKKVVDMLNRDLEKELEEVCELCGGTGEVLIDQPVYPGEAPVAPTGTQKCLCQTEDSHEYPDL